MIKETVATPWSMRRRIATVTGVTFVAAVVALIFAFDWNWLKTPIEKVVSSSTGRRFAIGGNITGEWRLTPRITMAHVTFANPVWAKNPLLLSADRVEMTIDLIPLITKRVHIIELSLVRPVVFLERLKDGRATWLFDLEQQQESSTPAIDALHVDNGTLQLHDRMTDTFINAKIQDKPAAKDLRSLKFQMQGTYHGQPLVAEGETASLLSLQHVDNRLPLGVRGTIAGTQVSVDGDLSGLTQIHTLNLRYVVKGQSLRQLAPVFGVPLLDTPPYSVSGQLTRSGNRWATSNLKGKVGNSDISGSVAVTTGGTTPTLEATLNSDLLDLADLRPLMGGNTTGGNTTTGNATPVGTSKVFPDRRFDLSRVRELNAHVILKAQRVMRVGALPFDNFFANFRLNNAVISLDPIEFGVADGKLGGKVSLDARQPTISALMSGRMKGVRVAKIFPEQAAVGKAAGTLSGFFDLQGRGNSVAAMLATASGRTTFLLAEGRVPSLLPAMIDLDGARVLASYFGKAPESVQCAAIDLGVTQGIAKPRVAVFETDSTVLTIDGVIDLRSETLALNVSQAPKRPSLFSIRTPVIVKGTLKSPQFSLDPAPLVLRGAAALLLGLINPLAAVVALVETGPGKDGSCPEMQRGMNNVPVGASSPRK